MIRHQKIRNSTCAESEVEGDRVSFVERSEARKKSGKNFDEVIDAKNMLALPEFVDTHVHLQEHLTRGFFPEGLSTRQGAHERTKATDH